MSIESITESRRPKVELATGFGDNDDVLVLGLTTGDDEPDIVSVGTLFDDAAASQILGSLAVFGASGKHGELTKIPAPPSVPVGYILAVGLGTEEDLTEELVRQAAGIAVRELEGVTTAVSTLSAVSLPGAAEGSVLGAYRFDFYRSAKSLPSSPPLEVMRLLTADTTSAAGEILERSLAIADAVGIARDLVNTPPNDLFPASFADRAAALGDAAGLEVEVLDEQQLADAGYGGIIGVGQGSSRPPRLVRLAHRVSGHAPTVALVGKGITFDTGGISIKPAANMDHMTSDMGGAAAVIATVVLAARRGVGVNVIATVPMAENMPSDTAQRPGDVLTQYGGTTVEVLNTDAEGRLILADGIVRALEDDPQYLMDTATLTGAQLVALGARTPGVMGTDDFRDRVAEISREVGENGWAMPFPVELRADLNSRVADLANVTNSRNGGMLAAGIFLREFVTGAAKGDREGVQWAHIDVAGPAFNTGGTWGYTPKGGTGVPVRTMFGVIESIAADVAGS